MSQYEGWEVRWYKCCNQCSTIAGYAKAFKDIYNRVVGISYWCEDHVPDDVREEALLRKGDNVEELDIDDIRDGNFTSDKAIDWHIEQCHHWLDQASKLAALGKEAREKAEAHLTAAKKLNDQRK